MTVAKKGVDKYLISSPIVFECMMLNKTHTVDHIKEGFNFFWICFLPFIESRTGLYDAPVLGNEVLCIPGMK